MSTVNAPAWRWRAVDTVAAIRAGRSSALEVVRSVLARIAEVNPSINAFALLDAQGALSQAAWLDESRAAGRPAGSLEGVAFHVKDLIPTAGLETAYGSWSMAGNVPDADVRSVARLKAAGAVLIGKTTTPEFGTKIQTNSPRYGHTRNPWNLDRTPGGSSGGAAAAVASGMGCLGVNTDGAGSARVPASCCGVLGLKPSLGLVPNDMAAALFENNQYVGLNTRSVDDLALALTVMNGPDAYDPWTLGRRALTFSAPRDLAQALRGLRILHVPRMGNSKVHAGVEQRVDEALQHLQSMGAQVTCLDEPFDWGIDLSTRWLRTMLRARLSPMLDTWRDRLDPELVAVLEGSARLSEAERLALPLQRTQLFRRVQGLFDRFDLVVSPTLSAPPIALDHASSQPMLIGGEVVGTLREAWYPYTAVANLTGHPALSVPVGFTDDGLPVGLQAMGRLHEDQTLIDLAAVLESVRPWDAFWPSVGCEPDASTQGGAPRNRP